MQINVGSDGKAKVRLSVVERRSLEKSEQVLAGIRKFEEVESAKDVLERLDDKNLLCPEGDDKEDDGLPFSEDD